MKTAETLHGNGVVLFELGTVFRTSGHTRSNMGTTVILRRISSPNDRSKSRQLVENDRREGTGEDIYQSLFMSVT